MKAAVLYDINTPLKIERMVLPNIENDQVRIRLVASGVCHSDWHVRASGLSSQFRSF